MSFYLLYHFIQDALTALLNESRLQDKSVQSFMLGKMVDYLERMKDQYADEIEPMRQRIEDLEAERNELRRSPPIKEDKYLIALHEDLKKRIEAYYPGFWPDEIEAMNKGLKIDAIKLHRMRTNVSLKESKDLVEEYIRTNLNK